MDEIQTRITDFKQLCRLCLHEKGVLIDIFDSSEGNSELDIYQKIKACAAIDLSKGDGLPTRICSPCLSSLNAAFEFRVQCENADKMLHEIYHLLESDQVIYEKKKEKKIYWMRNDDVEAPAGEKKEFVSKQLVGYNQVLVIQKQNNEAYEEEEEEGNTCDNDNDNGEKDREKMTVGEESVYVISSFQNNAELSDNIIVDEIISVSEEGNPSSDFHNLNAKEITKHNENSTKRQETNLICLEKGTKRNKIVQEAKRSACPFCHKMLTRVNEHIRLLHRNKVYVCKKNDCGAEFLTLKNLQSHQLKCFNMEKPYKCSSCFKEFYRKCNYKAHIVRHSNKKAFQCQLCDKAFVDSTGLRRHFLKHHEPQQETFTSGCCGKNFKTKEGLKQHIQKGICGVRIFPITINKIISN